ncbi:MAG: hypothetical protein ACOYL5_12360 [Phototrophicaceae bacterium]|jgi:hypothetical protein
MSENPLASYEYLWTTQKGQWVLLADEESRTERDFVIYHLKSWRILLIDDPDLSRAVIEQLIAVGTPQVTDEDIFGKS